MGIYTLADFREELHHSFGDRGILDQRLDRWINAAYFRLCGKVVFENLSCEQTITTVAGVFEYPLPDQFLGFISLADTSNKYRLRRIDLSNVDLYATDEDYWGTPTVWAHRADTLVLLPVPDDAYNLKGTFIKYPDKLSLSSDTTVLTPVWDQVVLAIARYYGLIAFNHYDEAAALYTLFNQEIKQIQKDEEWMEPTPMAHLEVAWDEGDITAMDNG